jgi:sugar O-acyltransferase (sialic acid O-acetyltransferase NeuD family)
MTTKSYIFGNGGFAREVFLLAQDCDVSIEALVCLEISGYSKLNEILEHEFDPIEEFHAYVAIGQPAIRRSVVEKLIAKFGEKVTFPKLIHPTSRIMGLRDDRLVGEGSIICANCVVTSDAKIGNFSQLNLHTTIGHDTIVGDYFTTAPGVHISGCCLLQQEVYFGTNSCTRENIEIVSAVTVGCGAAVVRNITESGIYAGVPARRIKHG